MPRYVTSVHSTWPAERALAYMADFSNAREWDPSVVRAVRVDRGPVREGSSFELRIRSGTREMTLRYVITALDGRRVVFRADSRRLESIDAITVDDAAGGSQIGYDAYLSGKGLARLANPLLARSFRRMAAAAQDRLASIVSR